LFQLDRLSSHGKESHKVEIFGDGIVGVGEVFGGVEDVDGVAGVVGEIHWRNLS